MPVTKTAKRALRSSKQKQVVNSLLKARFAIALRKAKATPTAKNVKAAISLTDKAAKKNLFHKNKAARIKSRLSKLVRLAPKPKKTSKK